MARDIPNDDTPEIGDVIRRIRKDAGMTIDDLAAATGLSRAYISQVETSKAAPSLQTIRRICRALDVSPALLFEDPEAGCVLLRSDRQKVMHFETVIDGETFHKAINVLSEQNKKLEMVLIELSPGNIAGDHAHPGEEIFYVLQGEMTITHGSATYLLREGDSVHIDSQLMHRIHNHGSEPVKIISARTPPGFIDLRHEDTLKLMRN
ncbi:MAG: helix-turn-helix domain-containing protein [Paracoccaceae bacterium]